MKVKAEKSCLISINIGDKVIYNDEEVTIMDYVLTPNGRVDPKLVCLVYAKKENGNMVWATSDRFFPIPSNEYNEFYPTPHMFNLK